jgi:uncharacterized protein
VNPSPSLFYAAPFAALLSILALERWSALPPLTVEAGAAILLTAVIVLVWRYVPDLQRDKLRIRYPFGTLVIGVGMFGIWIAPDVLISGYRHHVWFENWLLGRFTPGLTEAARAHPAVIWLRAARAIVFVPFAEELFWRAWMMRWIVRDKFLTIPLGAYSPSGFWIVALLFGLEHGPQWDVGIIAGVIYNWWMVRTRSLGDLILVHALTNACLSAYVIGTGKWEYWP